MDENKRLALIEKAKKGELRDKNGNSLSVDHPSLRKLFAKEEKIIKEVVKSVSSDEITKVVSLITKSLDENKKAQKEASEQLLASQKDILSNTEKANKDLLETIKQVNKPVSAKVEEPTPKKLEQWEFIHKRNKSGKLVSTIAKQIG